MIFFSWGPQKFLKHLEIPKAFRKSGVVSDFFFLGSAQKFLKHLEILKHLDISGSSQIFFFEESAQKCLNGSRRLNFGVASRRQG